MAARISRPLIVPIRAGGVWRPGAEVVFLMELARNLRRDTVARLDPAPPLAVEPSTPVAEAVRIMRAENVGCVLVSSAGQLQGIFTERDLMRRVLGVGKPLSLPIQDVMTPHPVTVRLRDPIRSAIRRMEAGGYRHLPVLDDDGRPVGVLSVKRVVHYLVEHYPAAVYNQPPSGQPPASAEGA